MAFGFRRWVLRSARRPRRIFLFKIITAKTIPGTFAFGMAGFSVFSRRPAGIWGTLLHPEGERVKFSRRRKKYGQNRNNSDSNMAFLAFLPVLRSKTGKNQPGAARENLLKWRFFLVLETESLVAFKQWQWAVGFFFCGRREQKAEIPPWHLAASHCGRGPSRKRDKTIYGITEIPEVPVNKY